jgi:exopolysaccharide biosynthesis predicted pyruvyltransferase EpsI
MARLTESKHQSWQPIPQDELLDALGNRIRETMGGLLHKGSRCALISFPHHSNVGDSAIWLGERDVLRTLKVRLVYTCDIRSYCKKDLADAIGDGTILLHGGGNLGDLWPEYQDFRETVIGDFPNNKVIQLPETMGFRRSENLQRTQRVFDKHPGLTLLLRDQRSLASAREAFEARSLLCPDMAFGMGRTIAPVGASVPILWLRRSDIESTELPLGLEAADIEVTDWLDEDRSRWTGLPAYLSFRFIHSLTWRLGHRVNRGPALALAYDRLARRRVHRGCTLLSHGRVVITDRLHGHILSLLLSLPHVLLDNNYGKVSAFFQTWTAKSRLANWADSPEEAIELAESLAAERKVLHAESIE